MASAEKQVGSLISGIDQAWIDKVHEAALEPDLPICDPHHHLWDRAEHRYLLPDFLADAANGGSGIGDSGIGDSGGHRIERSVFLECGAFYRADGPEALKPVGEVEFAAGIAAMSASGVYGPARIAAAIVGYADLMLGARAEAVLEALVAAGAGRFRGVRYGAAWDPGVAIASSHGSSRAGLYREPAFREGFARLGTLGLTFDAWVYHPQLQDVVDLARAFPGQPIVLNHVGGPIGIGPYAGRREAVFPIWRDGIRAVAACPNVFVKLGALGSKRAGFGWHERAAPPTSAELAAAWKPYVESCIEAFGAERCMFESNFPVDKASCGYTVLWNAFKRIAAGASADEKAALFSGTATRFYRIT